jgi:hypothetical protein
MTKEQAKKILSEIEKENLAHFDFIHQKLLSLYFEKNNLQKFEEILRAK